MAITTSSSISVNPRRVGFIGSPETSGTRWQNRAI
jgi:hypothetical protein